MKFPDAKNLVGSALLSTLFACSPQYHLHTPRPLSSSLNQPGGADCTLPLSNGNTVSYDVASPSPETISDDLSFFQDDAVLIDKHFYSPDAPTIVYVPEIHKELNSPDLTKAINIQKEIISLFGAAIKRYGKIAFAPERWRHGPDTNIFCRDQKTNSKLADLCSMAPPLSRVDRSAELLADPSVQTNPLLAAVYQHDLEMIDTETEIDRAEIREIARIRLLYNQIFNSKSPYCNLGQGKVKFSQVETRAFNNPEDKQATDCYCAAYQLDRDYNSMLNQRVSGKSIDEVKNAVEYAKNKSTGSGQAKTVFVVAGMMHMGHALTYLQTGKINYLVLAPKTIAEVAKTYLSPRQFAIDTPDLPNQTCSKTKDDLISALIGTR